MVGAFSSELYDGWQHSLYQEKKYWNGSNQLLTEYTVYFPSSFLKSWRSRSELVRPPQTRKRDRAEYSIFRPSPSHSRSLNSPFHHTRKPVRLVLWMWMDITSMLMSFHCLIVNRPHFPYCLPVCYFSSLTTSLTPFSMRIKGRWLWYRWQGHFSSEDLGFRREYSREISPPQPPVLSQFVPSLRRGNETELCDSSVYEHVLW